MVNCIWTDVRLFAIVVCFFSVSCAKDEFQAVLSVSPLDNPIQTYTNGSFTVKLSGSSRTSIIDRVTFTFGNYDADVALLPDRVFELDWITPAVDVDVVALKAGVTTATLHFTNNTANTSLIDTLEAFAIIEVYHNGWLRTLSTIIGYIYTVAWSISFYPQIISNWKRKSVEGLNFDFLAMNIVGFLFYSVNTAGLYFNHEIQREFFEAQPNQLNQAELNDVVFCFHAVFATLLTIIQCFLYERAGQRVSKMAAVFVSVLVAAVLIHVILIVAGVTKTHPWYTLLALLGDYKMLISLIKYVPQAVMNYRRESTVGWSIGNVLLDLTGGSFSFLQLFINSYNFDNWPSIVSNPAKLGLSVISIFFDILFIVQHYCLYRNSWKNIDGEDRGRQRGGGVDNQALEEDDDSDIGRIRTEFPIV